MSDVDILSYTWVNIIDSGRSLCIMYDVTHLTFAAEWDKVKQNSLTLIPHTLKNIHPFQILRSIIDLPHFFFSHV